jgi:hypothetical protein
VPVKEVIAMAQKKYTGDVNLFTYRRDKDSWRVFAAICKLTGTSPTALFDDFVDKYLDDNKVLAEVLSKR